MKQNNCKVIGITGGIGTGKSTVSNILKNKGYKVIDADKIARKAVEVGSNGYLEIVKRFGSNIILRDNTINRKALGHIIFNDSKARKELNSIIHPYIFESIKLELDDICKEEKMVFLDIPLLFEEYEMWEKYDILFDEIILVYLDKESQIKRLIKRNNSSKGEVIKKIESQLEINKKRKMSSKIIDNSGDFEYLNKQVNNLLLEIS